MDVICLTNPKALNEPKRTFPWRYASYVQKCWFTAYTCKTVKEITLSVFFLNSHILKNISIHHRKLKICCFFKAWIVKLLFRKLRRTNLIFSENLCMSALKYLKYSLLNIKNTCFFGGKWITKMKCKQIGYACFNKRD